MTSLPSPIVVEDIFPLLQGREWISHLSGRAVESQLDFSRGDMILAGGIENTSDIIMIDLRNAVKKTAYAAQPTNGE